MRRAVIIVLVCAAAAWLLLRHFGEHGNEKAVAKAPVTPAKQQHPVPAAAPEVVMLPVAAEAQRLLDPAAGAADDIAVLAVLLEEYRRHLGGNPIGDNDEITASLMGENPKGLACIGPGAESLVDASGRLIDRWGNPYFFHAVSGDRMEIVSPGPDGVLHTGDDLSDSE